MTTLKMDINKANATEVKAVAKELKIPQWWTKKKALLVEEILEITSQEEDLDKRSLLEKEVQEFLANGGEITVCKPQRIPRQKPPTEKSALKAPKRKKSSKTKSIVKRTPKRNNPDIITLKQLCDDLEVSPYKARKALRSAKEIEKPGKQWQWENSDKAGIKSITKFLKSLEG